jgi:hypothetical protein
MPTTQRVGPTDAERIRGPLATTETIKKAGFLTSEMGPIIGVIISETSTGEG